MPLDAVAGRAVPGTFQGRVDRGHEQLGELDHAGLGDILAVDGPVPDPVDDRGGQRPDLAGMGAQRRERLPGAVSPTRRVDGGHEPGGHQVPAQGAGEPSEILGGAQRIRVCPPEQAEEPCRRTPRPLFGVHREVSDGHQGGHVEEVMDVQAPDQVLPAAIQIHRQVGQLEAVRVDAEEFEVRLRHRRFHLAVPTLEVVAPRPALEERLARQQPLPYLRMAPGDLLPGLPGRVTDRLGGRAHRTQLVVREAVDEGENEVLEQRPVAEVTLSEAASERLRGELGLEAGDGSCPMRRVQEPHSGPGRCEGLVRGDGHGRHTSSRLPGLRRSSSMRTRTAQAAALPASTPSRPDCERRACQPGALMRR